MRQKIESIKLSIARPYVGEAVQRTTNKLVKYHADTRILELEQIKNRIESLVFDKNWPKGTENDTAFNLAIHEALVIIKDQLRK